MTTTDIGIADVSNSSQRRACRTCAVPDVAEGHVDKPRLTWVTSAAKTSARSDRSFGIQHTCAVSTLEPGCFTAVAAGQSTRMDCPTSHPSPPLPSPTRLDCFAPCVPVPRRAPSWPRPCSSRRAGWASGTPSTWRLPPCTHTKHQDEHSVAKSFSYRLVSRTAAMLF